jgi:uncharacterized protein (DUF302 family)
MTALAPIPFAFDAAVPAGRQAVHESGWDLDTTLARLKGAIEQADLWVLAELNPQMLLAKGGFEIRPARQIFYFHPRFMSRLLAANAAAIVEAPLKLVVLAPQNAPVSVRHPDIAAAFAGYGAMAEIAAELADITARIVTAALAR